VYKKRKMRKGGRWEKSEDGLSRRKKRGILRRKETVPTLYSGECEEEGNDYERGQGALGGSFDGGVRGVQGQEKGSLSIGRNIVRRGGGYRRKGGT